MVDWYPWVEAESDVAAPEATNLGSTVDRPPCESCAYWKPQVTFRHTTEGFVSDGVRLCHAEEMYFDFSCYKEK